MILAKGNRSTGVGESVTVTTDLKILNSRGSIDEDSGLLGCNAVLIGKQSPAFRRRLLTPFSGCSIPINTLRKSIQEECLATLNVLCLSLCVFVGGDLDYRC